MQVLPPLPWFAVLAGAVLIGWHAGGARLAALAGAAFLYLAVFGQWQSAMVTLVLHRHRRAVRRRSAACCSASPATARRASARVLVPVLDGMQTIPVFAYLLPILFLFGFGPVAGADRHHHLRDAADGARDDAGARQRAAGDRRVRPHGRLHAAAADLPRAWCPSARAPLMVGVNQVIMLSLNMVIIASMIGAGGLGYDVLTSLRRLDIGAGLEAGIAIVVLAVALDRISQAYARARQPAGRSRHAAARPHGSPCRWWRWASRSRSGC